MKFEREQLIKAQRASLDALSEGTDLLLAAIRDVAALGIRAKKSALQDGMAHTGALLGARNATELLSAAREVRHPQFEKTLTYGCVFYDLVTQTQARALLLAEMRTNRLKEMFVEASQAPSGSAAAPGSNAALEAVRLLIELGQLSLDAVKTNAREVAAVTENHIAAITLAASEMANRAERNVAPVQPDFEP
jgi:hypothetical protein